MEAQAVPEAETMPLRARRAKRGGEGADAAREEAPAAMQAAREGKSEGRSVRREGGAVGSEKSWMRAFVPPTSASKRGYGKLALIVSRLGHCDSKTVNTDSFYRPLRLREKGANTHTHILFFFRLNVNV